MTNPRWEVESFFDGFGGALFDLYFDLSILHKEIQTYPQLPRGMQRIRGPFVLVTVLHMWIDPLCNDTPSLDHFIRLLFIFVPIVL